MWRRAGLLAGLTAACLASRPAAALPPLAQLEADLGHAPAQQLAEREYRAERDSLAAGKADLGISAFGSLGAAHNHDIIDPTHSYTYDQGIGGAGLMLPLLGSRLKIDGALAHERIRLASLGARARLTRRELIGRLRRAYAAYWQARRQAQLARAYLRTESPVQRQLALRQHAGLTLDAERLQILTSFAQARADETSAEAQRRDALALMRDLTGVPLRGGAAALPRLSSACIARSGADQRWREQDPELGALRRIIRLRAADPRDSAWYPVQSNLQLSVQAEDQVTTGRHGASAALIWWFQVPLGYRSQRRRLAAAAAERLAAARLEYRMRRDALDEQRTSLLAQLPVLRQARTLAGLRLAAAREAVRERALRAAGLGGDAIGEWLEAEAARYSAATARLASDAALFDWYADWARFDTASCAHGPLRSGAASALPDSPVPAGPVSAGAANLGPALLPLAAARAAAPASRTGHGRTLYVWKAAAWLARATRGRAARKFAQLHSAGITALWISLDAGQLRRATAHPAMLRAAVRHTERAGFSVGLLLGDPSWILPRWRPALVRILAALRSVPFDRVELDLEPEQLHPGRARLPALLGSLANTLAAVRRVSPWPVGISIQPRDLAVAVDGSAFALRLERLRVSPTLMIYRANPERVVAGAAVLMRRYPRLTFHVALSLERSLPRTETLRFYPMRERGRRIARIEAGLAAPNFAGLVFELEDGWRHAGLLPAEAHP